MPGSLDMSEFLTKARRLIPFLPPLPLSRRGALEQNACLLYSRLPSELRMLIWEAYLGAHAVHVCRYSPLKKLRAKECLGWETDDRGPHFSRCGRAKVQCNHGTLLLTCKKIYFDFIHVLYGNTTFDFSHGPATAGVMYVRLPRTHLALITQVNFKWHAITPLNLETKRPGREEKIWTSLWGALAVMERLKWLRVELMPVSPIDWPLWGEYEQSLCSVVREVTKPDFFELVLPWPAATDAPEQSLPCTLVRKVPAYQLYLVQ